MLDTFILDDEKPSLDELKYHLSSYENINITGEFTSSVKALEAIRGSEPNLIFMDISMPKMNGIELADTIISEYPQIQIVFVTAFNCFAVDAFELNAVDYIVKPIHPERLDKTVKKLEDKAKYDKKVTARSARIVCMNTFEMILSDGKRISWRTKKCSELLVLLLQNKNKELSANQIIDLLWPDMDKACSKNMLYTTIYNLRKSLMQVSAKEIDILKINGSYILKCGCETDVEKIEKLTQPREIINDQTVDDLLAVQRLYTGDYLECHSYEWARQRQTFLRVRYIDLSVRVCKFLLDRKQYLKVIDIASKAVEIEPFEEKLYYLLCIALHAIRSTVRLKNMYEKYCAMMSGELGIEPLSLDAVLNWK